MKKLLLAFILLSSFINAQTAGCVFSVTPITICYPAQTKTIAASAQTDIIYLCGSGSVVWDTLNPPSIKYRQVFVNAGAVYNYKSTITNNQITVYAKNGSTVNVLPGTNLSFVFNYNKEAGAVLNNAGTGTITTNNCLSIIGPSVNCTSTGITEAQSAGFENTIWPNPSSGKIFINANTDEKVTVSLSVINQLGEVILSEDYINNGRKELSLEKYPTGIYFIRMKSGNFISTKKIILLK